MMIRACDLKPGDVVWVDHGEDLAYDLCETAEQIDSNRFVAIKVKGEMRLARIETPLCREDGDRQFVQSYSVGDKDVFFGDRASLARAIQAAIDVGIGEFLERRKHAGAFTSEALMVAPVTGGKTIKEPHNGLSTAHV